MYYFHNLSLASGGFAPRPHQGSIPGLCWGLGPQTPNLPTSGKRIPRVPTAVAYTVNSSLLLLVVTAVVCAAKRFVH